MQRTSELFDQIWESGNYESEIKVVINGVEYFENQLMDVSIKRELFGGNNVTIGSTCVASCSLTLTSDTMSGRDISAQIPRGARIEIWERIKGEVQDTTANAVAGSAIAGVAIVGIATQYVITNSEWLLQGVFFVDCRDYTSWESRLVLDGVDAMIFADADYPNQSDWPEDGKKDIDVVKQIAGYINVALDSGTSLGNNYLIPIPLSYTMREVLGFIAAMYGGNWVITKEGKLSLITLAGLPEETNFLVTNYGSPIMFGGDRILVS